LESDEIRYKQFKRSVRGYSPDDVDDLLDSVADEFDEARGERDRLSGELAEARRRIEEYESLESSIRTTLQRAEKSASNYEEAARRDFEATLEAAKREAEVVIYDAEARARRMLAESSSKIDRARRSYEAMQQAHKSLDSNLRSMLGNQLRLLDDTQEKAAREIEEPLQQRLDTEAISAVRSAEEENQRSQEDGATAESRDDSSRHEGDAVTEGSSELEEPEKREGVKEADQAHEPEDNASRVDEQETTASGNGEDEPESSAGESARRGRFLRRRG
jgi:cell division initiation protein